MGLLSWLNDLFKPQEEYGTPSVTLTGQPVRSKAERVIADYFTRHGIPYYYEAMATTNDWFIFKAKISRPDFKRWQTYFPHDVVFNKGFNPRSEELRDLKLVFFSPTNLRPVLWPAVILLFASVMLFPNASLVYGAQNVCNPLPCARARLGVTNFNQNDISWSLNVVVDGDARAQCFLAEIIGNQEFYPSYRYNSFYDSTRNQTTFYDSFLHTSFDHTYQSFPWELWYLQFYFAMVNASVQNAYGGPVVNQTVLMPTSNYQGQYSITPIASIAGASNPFNGSLGPAVTNSNSVYLVNVYVFRPFDIATSLVNLYAVAYIMWGALFVLGGALVLRIALYLITYLRFRSRPEPGKTWGKSLLGGSYFTIVGSIFFFLPIYYLSLRPLLAPLSFVPQDWILFVLMGSYGGLMIAAFVAQFVAQNLVDFFVKDTTTPAAPGRNILPTPPSPPPPPLTSENATSGPQRPQDPEVAREIVRFYWDYEKSSLLTQLAILFTGLAAAMSILTSLSVSSVTRLNPFTEAGLAALIAVYVGYLITKIAWKLRKLVIQMNQLLGQLNEGMPVQDLAALCHVTETPESPREMFIGKGWQGWGLLMVAILLSVLLVVIGQGFLTW